MSGRELRDTFALNLTEATRSGRTIGGVSVLGPVSKNGRRYTRRAREDVKDLIEGGRNGVYANHPEGGGSPVRGVETLVGQLRRPRLAGDRVKADLVVADAAPWSTLLPWIAEEAPDTAGLSIRARGRVRQADDGVGIVEGIGELHAVELVTEPATTSALVESVQRDRGDRVREVLTEAGFGEGELKPLVRHLARQPDGVEQARQFVEGFDRAVDPRRYRGRGGGGPAATAVERDPDEKLRESRRDGGRTPVTSDVLEEASRNLFN